MNRKVLIVDDEPIIRKGISSKINWQELQLEKAGEARNGMEAIAVMQQLKPDIVITDIRMPQMDGLQFIDQAKRVYPQVQFIIISGYSDFEYAQQAIRFGVTDYLLKPVNKDELKRALVAVKARGQQSTDDLSDREWESKMMLSRLLRQDVQEETRTAFEAMWRQRDVAPDSADLVFTVGVYRLEPVKLPYRSFGEQDAALFGYAIRNLIAHAADKEVGIHVFPQEANADFIAIYSYAAARPAWEGTSAIRRSAERALHDIRACLQLICSAGIGFAVSDASGLKQAYEAASAAVRGEVLAGAGKVYMHAKDVPTERNQAEASGPSFISSEQERLLLAYLREHDSERIRDWLEERYAALTKNQASTFAQFENLSLHIYTLLGKYLHESSRQTDGLPEAAQQFHPVLLSCRSWREMAAVLLQYAESILHLTADPHAIKGEQIVARVKSYIDSHYFENVSLSWVAEHFFIHPNYFSNLFKEKAGRNFNDYVTEVRLQKSIELMRDPNLGLTEIAALVGYDSYAYFSSVFRKWSGTSPRNYRNNLKNHK